MMKIITNLALLGLAYYAIFFLAKPQWEEAKVVKLEVNSYKETLDNISKMQEIRNKLLKEYNSISEDEKKKLERMFASSLNEGELIGMLDNLANSNSMTLTDISFNKQNASQSGTVIGGGGAVNQPYTPYSFSLSVKGSYNAFKNFLKNTEKSLVIIDIGSISFSSANTSEEKGGTDIYEYKMKGSVYLKK